MAGWFANDDAPRVVSADPTRISLPFGTENRILAGRNGELLMSAVHGDYYTAARNGSVFLSSSVIGSNLALPLNAASLVNTFTVANPLSSDRVLELIRFDMGLTSATTVVNGVTLGFAYWPGTPGQDNKTATVNMAQTLTALTPLAMPVGALGAAQVARGSCYSAMTLVNAAALTPCMNLFTFGAATDTSAGPLGYDFNGKVVLGPGAVGCFITTTAAATAAFLSLLWAEWPI